MSGFPHRTPAGRAAFWLAPTTFLMAVALVVALAVFGPGLLDALLPQTGRAFSPSPTPTPSVTTTAAPSAGPAAGSDDPCALIIGPAEDYCQRSGKQDAPTPQKHVGPDFDVVEAVMILPAACALLVLLVVRRR